jgi:hypothetical protein
MPAESATIISPALVSEATEVTESPDHHRMMHNLRAIGTWALGIGFLVFLGGVLMGSQSAAHASAVAIVGMLICFAGGAVRAKVA